MYALRTSKQAKKELIELNRTPQIKSRKTGRRDAVRNWRDRGSMSGARRTLARGRGAPTRWPPAAPGPASTRGTAARAPAGRAPAPHAYLARTSFPFRRSRPLLLRRRRPPVPPRAPPLQHGFGSAPGSDVSWQWPKRNTLEIRGLPSEADLCLIWALGLPFGYNRTNGFFGYSRSWVPEKQK